MCHMLCPSLHVPRRFAAINGLLLPGGGAKLEPGHQFYDTAEYLTKLSLEANDKGDYFPVWPCDISAAVCHKFQFLYAVVV